MRVITKENKKIGKRYNEAVDHYDLIPEDDAGQIDMITKFLDSYTDFDWLDWYGAETIFGAFIKADKWEDMDERAKYLLWKKLGLTTRDIAEYIVYDEDDGYDVCEDIAKGMAYPEF